MKLLTQSECFDISGGHSCRFENHLETYKIYPTKGNRIPSKKYKKTHQKSTVTNPPCSLSEIMYNVCASAHK
jgi:hypothetical protein